MFVNKIKIINNYYLHYFRINTVQVTGSGFILPSYYLLHLYFAHGRSWEFSAEKANLPVDQGSMEYLPENRNFDWYLFIREHINFSHSWISLNWGYECNTFLALGSNWIAIWLVKLTIPFLAFNTYPQFFLMVKPYLLVLTLSEKRIKIIHKR